MVVGNTYQALRAKCIIILNIFICDNKTIYMLLLHHYTDEIGNISKMKVLGLG